VDVIIIQVIDDHSGTHGGIYSKQIAKAKELRIGMPRQCCHHFNYKQGIPSCMSIQVVLCLVGL
jgi:hypothetical protein